MYLTATIVVMAALVLTFIRLFKGPTVFDRVVAANAIGTIALMLIVLIGFLTARPEFLDIAITYGLLNVISTIAILKFFKQRNLSTANDDPAHERNSNA